MRWTVASGIVLAGFGFIPAAPSVCAGFDPLDTNHLIDFIVLAHDDLAAQAAGFLDDPDLRGQVVTTSEVLNAFGGGSDTLRVEHVRAFVEYAYESWRITPSYLLLVGDACYEDPTYDLIPSYMRVNEWWQEVGWACTTYCWEYADDGWVVGGVDGDQKPIMHIGRVPARNATQLTNYLTKAASYETQAIAGEVLFLVGDRDTNYIDNSVMRTISDNLMGSYIPQQCPVTSLYAADYDEGYPQSATADTRDAWNSGCALVNAFGNAMSECDLVLMAYGFCCDEPTFTPELSPSDTIPVLFAGTCLVNFFFGDGPWGCQYPAHCVAEDLLLSCPNRGAVASFASDHVTPCFENAQMNRVFLETFFGEAVRDLGRLCTATEVEYLREDIGLPLCAEEFCLLGDPTIQIRMPVVGERDDYHVRAEYGAEIEEPRILQDTYYEDPFFVSNPNVRILHCAGDVRPPRGERMIRATARLDAGVSEIVWKLADTDLFAPRNSILAFRIYVAQSPGDEGKVCLDAELACGDRLSYQDGVFDQYGVVLDAPYRQPLSTGWHTIYADLSPLACDPVWEPYDFITALLLSCRGSSAGSLLVYVDDIQIRPTNTWQGELLNPDFEEDVDGDQKPDFWTNLDGECGEEITLCRDFACNGLYSMKVSDRDALGLGAKQIVHLNRDSEYYYLRFKARANLDSEITYRVRRLDTGQALCEATQQIDRAWKLCIRGFENPWYFGLGVDLVSVEIVPASGHIAYVDSASLVGGVMGSVEDGAGTSLVTLGLAISPNPANPTCHIKFRLPGSGTVTLAIYDIHGRLVRELARENLGSGIYSRVWDGRDHYGTPVASGIYLCRLKCGEEAITRKIVVLR